MAKKRKSYAKEGVLIGGSVGAGVAAHKAQAYNKKIQRATRTHKRMREFADVFSVGHRSNVAYATRPLRIAKSKAVAK